jgi:formyl-CoA transferase
MATGAWSNSCQIQAAMLGAVFPIKRPRVAALNPLINQYQARDGRRFMFCCLDTANDWGRICRAIGRTELIEHPRYSTAKARSENTEEVVAILDEALGRKDMAEWEVLFREENIIWGPIPTIDRVAADEQMKSNGVFAELDHPQIGPISTVNNPLNIHGVAKERPRPAPGVGEHSREILGSIGYDEQEVEKLLREGVVTAQ